MCRLILHQNGNVANATAKFLWQRVERLLDYLDEMLTLHPSPPTQSAGILTHATGPSPAAFSLRPGAAPCPPCAAPPARVVPQPPLFRFLPAASDLPDHSPHSRASTSGLRDGALGAERDTPDSSDPRLPDPGSVVAHGARARSVACRSCSPPCRLCGCVGCAEKPAGEARAGSVQRQSGWDRGAGKRPEYGAVPDKYPDRVCP